jgi:hypothetical protein
MPSPVQTWLNKGFGDKSSGLDYGDRAVVASALSEISRLINEIVDISKRRGMANKSERETIRGEALYEMDLFLKMRGMSLRETMEQMSKTTALWALKGQKNHKMLLSGLRKLVYQTYRDISGTISDDESPEIRGDIAEATRMAVRIKGLEESFNRRIRDGRMHFQEIYDLFVARAPSDHVGEERFEQFMEVLLDGKLFTRWLYKAGRIAAVTAGAYAAARVGNKFVSSLMHGGPSQGATGVKSSAVRIEDAERTGAELKRQFDAEEAKVIKQTNKLNDLTQKVQYAENARTTYEQTYGKTGPEVQRVAPERDKGIDAHLLRAKQAEDAMANKLEKTREAVSVLKKQVEANADQRINMRKAHVGLTELASTGGRLNLALDTGKPVHDPHAQVTATTPREPFNY